MSETLHKLTFPKVTKVTLRSFSLYSSQPIVQESIPDGVFCLAGANGLGKSTFLAAVNYALTGIVSNPKLDFKSVDEYYRYSSKFSAEFFTGRITEADRDAAEIEIELTIGSSSYLITRGMFEPTALREFTVRGVSENSRDVIVDGEDMTPSERHVEYIKQITRDVGVDSFEQFVFLQHFILTFDEQRLLLFFESKLLEQALYLAFGVNPTSAKRADTLRRESERADSLVRNFNWQASEVRKKIKDIEERAASASTVADATDDLVAEHQRLQEEHDQQLAETERIESSLRDATLKLASASSEQVALRVEYEEEFSLRIQQRSHVTHHPLVASSIADASCGLCGADGNVVVERIRARVHETTCPLCQSPLSKEDSRSRSTTKLLQIDEKLSKVKLKLDEAVRMRERLSPELDAARQRLDTIRGKLEEYERFNESVLLHLQKTSQQTGGVASLLETYRVQMEEFLTRKDEQKQRRDEKKVALRKLQRDLEKQYSIAEIDFIPLFKDLAYSFLGLDLDIRMETSASPSINLALEVKGAVRRSNHQLSESQRFFVDIALRMSLVQFMSSPAGRGCLFIDTPEGSLDIAYENRAGDMLAKFVEAEHNIIMTANINSSRLIQSLAEHCGHEKMTLCRMTDWAELSEVQIAEEGLFEEAYKTIEGALNSHDLAPGIKSGERRGTGRVSKLSGSSKR